MFRSKRAGCCTSSSSEVSESDTTELYLSISTPLPPSPDLCRTRGQAHLAGDVAVPHAGAVMLGCACDAAALVWTPVLLAALDVASGLPSDLAELLGACADLLCASDVLLSEPAASCCPEAELLLCAGCTTFACGSAP